MSNPETEPNMPRTVRLADVAAEAGISRAAAAKALLGSGGRSIRVSEETCKKVQRIARELGYTPNQAARQLKGISNRTLGLVLDTTNTQVMTDRLFAIEEEAARRGYRLLIGRTHQQPAAIASFLDEFKGRGVEGLICLFDLTRGFDEKVRRMFTGRDYILFHGRQLIRNSFAVRVDTASAIRQLVNHLHERGRSRIGMGLEHMTDMFMSMRTEAYEAAMGELKLPTRDEWIWSARKPASTPTDAMIDEAIDQLILQQKLEAIIAADDNLALSTVIDPALTTIDQLYEDYAAATLDLLLQPKDQPPAESIRTIEPRLIVRAST